MGESIVTKLDSKRRRIDLVVDEADVARAVKRARATVGELSRRPLGVKQLGENPEQTKENAVLSRATREVAESAIRAAVEEHGLRLSANPKSEIAAFVQEGQPFSFSVEVEVVPEFDLKPFDKLVVRFEADTAVSDEDVDARLEEIRGRSATVEKDSAKPISENDIVELSFESFVEGKPYEGSSVKGYAYAVGSELLPAAFEAGLVGMTAGQSKTIEFTVPSDFANPAIAGKDARFDVVVNRVASCSLPELDDAFAQEFGYEDLAFWRNKIKAELAVQREAEVEDAREKAARETLADLLEGGPDDAMIDASAQRMLQAFKADLKKQGVDFAEYSRFLNLTEADVLSEMREESSTVLRENLALESLFRLRGLKVTDAELRQTVAQLAEDSGMPAGVAFEEFNQEQQAALREMTMHRMATDWIMEHAVFEEG
ncbi:trigger factor [Adlercreutzia sp. ZJ242]|uniref:trigger factor n=1 Tax=Adlercreutzia sp. ZJ242 TaxID=2709409 RepID=UPI0013EC5866|nr:trigger factor [Adlercreutzia sp. ZJ242]